MKYWRELFIGFPAKIRCAPVQGDGDLLGLEEAEGVLDQARELALEPSEVGVFVGRDRDRGAVEIVHQVFEVVGRGGSPRLWRVIAAE